MSLEIVSNEFRNEDDLETITKLSHLYFGDVHMVSFKQHRRSIYKEFKKPFFGKQNDYVIAYDSSTLLGFALHGKFDPDESSLYSEAISHSNFQVQDKPRSIKLIAVNQELQHAGIGTKMTERLIENCYKLGEKQLFALCWMGNGGKSYRMFEKLGFRSLKYFREAYANRDSGIVVAKELL